MFSVLSADVTGLWVIKSSSPQAGIYYDLPQPTNVLDLMLFPEVLPQDHPQSWSLKTALETAFSQVLQNKLFLINKQGN
jgi:hypothetical protein